ncbi:FKBP-type peptidyl-prolyl cis-trans isomerase [Ferrimonas gelatinilytica]|uniref:Peptidyl-prolyl cis-trans isomerase n=1 Tax=Ferrimonas gelatinilytica TaxID=1255257 RepID=A0ABP9RX44_9GAMM
MKIVLAILIIAASLWLYQRNLTNKKQVAHNEAAGEVFLQENASREGVEVTDSGLQYEVLQEGAGDVSPKATDRVTVHYHGTLLDGTVFDSSVERGQPATFGLNQVIPGWTEGVQTMVVGQKNRFYLPAKLAYGNRGVGSIPPGSMLIFEVELLDID